MPTRNPKRTQQAPGTMKRKVGRGKERKKISTRVWVKEKNLIIRGLISKFPELDVAKIEQLAEREMIKLFRPS